MEIRKRSLKNTPSHSDSKFLRIQFQSLQSRTQIGSQIVKMSSHAINFMLANLVLVEAAQRSASVHEVQPSTRDRVHAVWLNGPTFTSKLSGGANLQWPSFQDDLPTRSRRSSNLCSLSPRRL